jgi:hypothetical protein
MSLLVSTPILSQLQSPLLRLPGEIRNKIYEHVLGESIPLHVVGFHYSHWGAPYKTHARRLHQINELERTCRKLRAETGNMGRRGTIYLYTRDMSTVPSFRTLGLDELCITALNKVKTTTSCGLSCTHVTLSSVRRIRCSKWLSSRELYEKMLVVRVCSFSGLRYSL